MGLQKKQKTVNMVYQNGGVYSMQKQFMLRAAKKFAALSTSAAMMGATMTGALALDLAEYPAPFVTAGTYDDSNAFVVGAGAAAADTLGVSDLTTGLQFESKVCTASGGSVSVSGGVSENIPLGMNISDSASTTLDQELGDDDISSLLDSSITFRGSDYDVQELIVFGQTTGSPTVETSLTSSEDDYETGIFIEAQRDNLKYYYAFDEAIEPNATTASDSLQIKFLGQTLKITNVASNTKFTAQVGAEFFMNVGDSVEVDGKSVTLDNVGSGGAIVVSVDGVTETIPSSGTETVNGVEIVNDETFYEDNKDQRSATVVIGKDAQETYSDGDAYVGEDKDDPAWVWNVAGLQTSPVSATTTSVTAEYTGPYFGVENDFVYNDDSDNPPGAGECIDYPNNYVSICFDSISVPDDKYMTVTVERDGSSDISEALGASFTGVNAVFIHTAQSEGLVIDTSLLAVVNGTSTSDIKTEKLWLYIENETRIQLIYEDTNGRERLAGWVTAGQETTSNSSQFAHINYDNTKDSDVLIHLDKTQNTHANVSGSYINLTFVPFDGTDLPNRNDNITVVFQSGGTTGFSRLGTVASSEEAGELVWRGRLSSGAVSESAIGAKDEDHRSKYGIIVRDPKSNGASDTVVLDIPGDQVNANIVVKGRTTVVGGGGNENCVVAEVNPKLLLHNEVTNPSASNLVLVGGPCANPLVEDLGFGVTCAGWSMSEGEALVKLINNGDKVALLVAGTLADDTRRAAKALANFQDYAFETTEVVVRGTSFSDITVESGGQ
ncbi:MAG: hypothetical protein AABW49_02405 [Nanoarchaeota archaeon]